MKRFLPLILLSVSLCHGCGDDFDTRLQREATEYTRKHCPQKLDGFTTLDSVAYSPAQRTYTRYLSLSPQTPASIFERPETVRNMLLQELKADVGWKRCKDEGIRFAYVYHWQQDGKVAYSLVFTSEDYNR